MAKRIYFPDGSHEDFLCPEYPENDMARIVRERLGDDFADMCDPYIFGSEEEPRYTAKPRRAFDPVWVAPLC